MSEENIGGEEGIIEERRKKTWTSKREESSLS